MNPLLRRTTCSAKSPLPCLLQWLNVNGIHTTAVQWTFWEKEKKSGYRKELPLPSKKVLIIEGLRELKKEIKLWQQEITEKFECDPILCYRPGEVDVVFRFNDADSLDKWVVTADSDHKEGKSIAELVLSPTGVGLFRGCVNSEHLKDGIIKRTGYANIRTKRVLKSFKRETTYDWAQYNTLVMKVRGDGRSYLLNLHTEGYYDLFWNDVYHFALFTRGGPHWQIVKIPFSKFFLASKGRVQDRQGNIALNRVTHFGLSVSAKNGMDGPFGLEIDYIGLEFDPNHREQFAYEMYKTSKYIVAT